VPRLWSETIADHRRAVHDATVEAAAALVAEHGLASVTMSQIAERAGIARATLYRYFPDVEAVLTAWHEKQVASHLQQLADVRDAACGAGERLEAVLLAYARLARHQDGSTLAAQLHRGAHVLGARARLHDLLRELLLEAAHAGELREDVPPEELATFVLAALSAAGQLRSPDAVRRLVDVVLAGLRRGC
jgi:AcrR family transcriptional regulator